MKLKTLKPHYYESQYMMPPTVYMADKLHGETVVKRGICSEVKTKKSTASHQQKVSASTRKKSTPRKKK